ncbi:carbohydrate-binding module family 20 domain-containing protein [Pseudomonas lurida]|uniref:carbohydrate-binding module family 20 domain-containing protein n=2 Tax=Pseudomonas lurida TaxID=244566 RepID=UPI002E34C9A7|nr:carbohydrate-binding module family 20 domain-containing protein [Pseudomonas lurida]
MSRTNCLLALGAFLLTLLPLANAGQNAQMTYFLSASFTCLNGNTTPGYSVYVVGSHREIGEWKTENAVLLTTTRADYPKWTGQVRFSGVQLDEKVQWKCIIRNEAPPIRCQGMAARPKQRGDIEILPASAGHRFVLSNTGARGVSCRLPEQRPAFESHI